MAEAATTIARCGRPSIYSPELAERVCQRIEDGESLSAAARAEGLHPGTFHAWMSDMRQNGVGGAPDASEKEALYQRYRRARAVQADWWGDRVASVADATLAGEHEPNAARVAIYGYQWAAARMAPKTWGENVQHNHGGSIAVGHVHAHLVAERGGDTAHVLQRIAGLLQRAGAEGETPSAAPLPIPSPANE